MTLNGFFYKLLAFDYEKTIFGIVNWLEDHIDFLSLWAFGYYARNNPQD